MADAERKEYQTVVLAAFLHDIGKALMRGDFGSGLRIEGQHPQVSANFVSAFKELFSKISDPDLLLQLVQRHHEDPGHFPPELLVQGLQDDYERTLARLISKADNLSAAERGEASEQRQDYKTVPLMSVLERVNRGSDDELRLRYHARPLPSTHDMSSDESDYLVFPRLFEVYSAGELNRHLQRFGAEFRSLFREGGKGHTVVNNSSFDAFLAHLITLVYRYTWCIPANTQETVPDVSLFDHLKTTAAIAACLYRYHAASGSLSEEGLAHPGADRFCLLVGDISGIQRYIFDIAHIGVGGVARRLRARSLYVQLCSEVAGHVLLHRFDLPLLNVIMNSGGKFYLLLPNLPQTLELVEQAQKQADEWLLHYLNGELSLNLACVTFDEEGFKTDPSGQTGFGRLLRQLAARLDQRKRTPLASCLSSAEGWDEDSFLVGAPFAGKRVCRSCGKFPASFRSSPDADEEDLCPHCHRDALTGSRLTNARNLVFYSDPDQGDLPVLGYSVTVETTDRGITGQPYLVMNLNTMDTSGLAAYPAVARYLANHVARMGDCPLYEAEDKTHGEETQITPDAPAPFECIAHRSEGAELLGFLKADVDNLGKTFVFGLRREKEAIDTISRLTTMSRMLDMFFSGWIEHLTATEFRDCYTVFSGGDDLLIVGPWDRIPLLAERIRSDLDRFTGNPQGITLSAGVLLAKAGFPIARAAGEAEMLLESSKKASESEKDRITILGHTLSWAEWQVVREEWEKLKIVVSEDGKVPSAFLYSLLLYARMWRDYKSFVESGGQKGDVLGLRYQPLLAYSIARNLDRRQLPDLYAWAESLLELRPGDKKQKTTLDNLELIASLLIYGRRGGKE
ncbi:MAG: type III-A CRISPR-associated protein Cas10/Csm1 [Chloroflexi bacterium]|nr:MAG: type III-A CRISPR-associated protein Cas10/Csm1 [Chloroflexota bacterium]